MTFEATFSLNNNSAVQLGHFQMNHAKKASQFSQALEQSPNQYLITMRNDFQQTEGVTIKSWSLVTTVQEHTARLFRVYWVCLGCTVCDKSHAFASCVCESWLTVITANRESQE